MARKRQPNPAANAPDIAEWGEKDLAGAYPEGTTFDLGDGEPVDVTKVPDILGGEAPPDRSSQ